MRYTLIAVVDIAAVHNRRAMRRGKASAAE